ncbi:MAG: acyl-CoA dehydrogenase family protein [bacterium]
MGELNKGWTYICEALDLERFGMMPIGAMEMKVDTLCKWVMRAERDGAPLRDDPVARHTIALLVTQLEVARMMQRRVERGAQGSRAHRRIVDAQALRQRARPAHRQLGDGADGPAGLLKRGNEGAPMDGLRALVSLHRGQHHWRRNPEIQKNIIARRQLGLPLVV